MGIFIPELIWTWLYLASQSTVCLDGGVGSGPTWLSLIWKLTDIERYCYEMANQLIKRNKRSQISRAALINPPNPTLVPHIEGILPKGPYLPCVSMAGRPFWQDTFDICVSQLVQIMVCRLLGTKPSSNDLNQCWLIVNWNLRIKLQWDFNQNTKLSFTNMHPKISSAKWRPFCPGEMSMYLR